MNTWNLSFWRSNCIDEEQTLKYGRIELRSKHKCGERPVQPKLNLFLILSLVTVLTAIVLIGCVLFLFRMRRRKQGPFTMTTLVDPPQGGMQMAAGTPGMAGVDPGSGGVVDSNGTLATTGAYTMSGTAASPGAMHPGMMGSSPGHMMMNNYERNQAHMMPASSQGRFLGGSTKRYMAPFRIPPMGSTEAEFQNDFIAVFPMHHLTPMPDKNSFSNQ